ncbi:unnamed protein product [Heligmosomoides polygyrus]|uniref:Reverse transcriptase n=1 Tax=Heligmosomoides polygyrus TaxID=6339 RepID=A0A183F6K0_HELPZ|nr:unnamed protein product [Heligmosomoides polygyrus]
MVQYKLKIEYVKGKANPVANDLSRGILWPAHKVEESDERDERVRLPKVGARVLMKLPRERAQRGHPKLTVAWDGPFRVLEASENSARIGREEEPLRFQMDLLRVCPEEITDEPIESEPEDRPRGGAEPGGGVEKSRRGS